MLKIDEFSNQSLENINEKLLAKAKDLISKISQAKNMEIDINNSFTYDFDYDYSLFKDLYLILCPLTNLNDLSDFIAKFNEIETNLTKYLTKKEELQNQDLSQLWLDYQTKFATLFNQMLQYKHKTYHNNLFYLLNHLIFLYPYYEDYLNALSTILKTKALFAKRRVEDGYQEIEVASLTSNYVELFNALDQIYDELQTYPQKASLYPELESPDATYETVIDQILLKYQELFHQMLKAIGHETSKEDFELLEEIYKYYPFYKDHLQTYLMKARAYEVGIKSLLDYYNFYQNDYSKDYLLRFNQYESSTKI